MHHHVNPLKLAIGTTVKLTDLESMADELFSRGLTPGRDFTPVTLFF
jgi:hypothetical protein